MPAIMLLPVEIWAMVLSRLVEAGENTCFCWFICNPGLTFLKGDASAVMSLAQVSGMFAELVRTRKRARCLVRPFVLLAKRGTRWSQKSAPNREYNWNIYVHGDHCELTHRSETATRVVVQGWVMIKHR